MTTFNAWTFRTSRFSVTLELTELQGYQYDGDDLDGATQAALDSGALVAFDSDVYVRCDGRLIGSDSLGGSVYYAGCESEFWTAHRDPDPMNRNCTVGAEARGGSIICHYFPDMVRLAIAEARSTLCKAPKMRCAA